MYKILMLMGMLSPFNVPVEYVDIHIRANIYRMGLYYQSQEYFECIEFVSQVPEKDLFGACDVVIEGVD